MTTSSRTVALTCGDAAGARWGDRLLARAGLASAEVRAVARRPGRGEVDPLLEDADRLVVAGDDADLAAVLVRLLRRERLDLPVAFLPAADSTAAAVWGLPTGPDAALALLRSGTVQPVPLIRDDRGGIVAGAHHVGPFRGAVYCDEHLVASGTSAGMAVRPWAGGSGGDGERPGGVSVTVTGPSRWGGLRAGRADSARGRAVQIGCRPAAVHRDGVPDERTLERRSWYRHLVDWHLVRPAPPTGGST